MAIMVMTTLKIFMAVNNDDNHDNGKQVLITYSKLNYSCYHVTFGQCLVFDGLHWYTHCTPHSKLTC